MSDNAVSIQPALKKTGKLPVIIIVLIPFIISFFQLRFIDNDFYFLYATGEYIVKNGFPFTDMLSMHSSMKIVVQQWLSSVIFYYIYLYLGKYGIFALLYICYAAICYLTFSLSKLITNNPIVSAFTTAIANFLVFDAFMVTRPQMITYVILLTEVYLLEKHVQTKNVKYLFAIPVLSLLLINLHGAMWAMLLVFMLPYLVSAVFFKTKNFTLEAQGNLLALLATFAGSIVVGLLNPYSWEAMIYLTTSYGQSSLSIISEMHATSLDSTEGFTLFIVLGVIFLIVCFIKKRLIARRFFLLFAGTLLLGLLQIKGIPYFYLIGIPAFTYMIKDFDPAILKKPLKDYDNKKYKTLAGIFLTLCLVYVCEARFFTTKELNESREKHYKRLDEVIAILDQSEEPVVLYTNFNDGQYLEFNGYHPFIDGRAELYLYKNNKEYDYFIEYSSLKAAGYYYREFVDKYEFNYFILNKSTDSYLYFSLLHDKEYELVYYSYDVNLFVKKTAEAE